jgi:uncharacterized cupredoxin-like copper-binding protein
MRITSLALALTLAVLPVAGLAHGDAPRKAAAAQPMVETDFGRTGDPRKAARTIRVDMSDRMRFSPDTIEVKPGDTVRFVVRNSGRTMHEMVLDDEGAEDHARLMKKHPAWDDRPTWRTSAGQDRRDRVAVHQGGRVLLRLPDPGLKRGRDGRKDPRALSGGPCARHP